MVFIISCPDCLNFIVIEFCNFVVSSQFKSQCQDLCGYMDNYTVDFAAESGHLLCIQYTVCIIFKLFIVLVIQMLVLMINATFCLISYFLVFDL